MGSTDMGNVSHLVPSIHPMIKVAPDGVPIHTASSSPSHARRALGDPAVLDGAKAMAMTVVDLWARPAELREAGAAGVRHGRPKGEQVL
jgi:metal-dependent amidase/aminoacylase/carboxypeptidase family protein